MSLRDRFKIARPGDDGPRTETSIADLGPVGDEPMFFAPTTEIDYVAADLPVTLRFGPGSLVTERSVPDDGDPATGSYSTSGRFMVLRRFGRPVVYTALEFAPQGFRMRRTDTGTRQTGAVEFRPAGTGSGAAAVDEPSPGESTSAPEQP